MKPGIKLICSYLMGGHTGWVDSVSSVYSVHAKTSNWATPEQNGKLEAKLLEAYRDYLQEVAENNGMY